MENQNMSFNSQDDEQANKTNKQQQPEKTWDGPLLEPERTAQYEKNLINERLDDEQDKDVDTDSAPLRSELDPPTAPDITPDQSPDEINYPGKKDFPKIEQPQSATTSIGNDNTGSTGNDAQELQIADDKKREENIKEKNAELREAVEGKHESIRKSEEGNISDQRGYNEIRENSPVNDERHKEFLN